MTDDLELNIISDPVSQRPLQTKKRRGARIWDRKKGKVKSNRRSATTSVSEQTVANVAAQDGKSTPTIEGQTNGPEAERKSIVSRGNKTATSSKTQANRQEKRGVTEGLAKTKDKLPSNHSDAAEGSDGRGRCIDTKAASGTKPSKPSSGRTAAHAADRRDNRAAKNKPSHERDRVREVAGLSKPGPSKSDGVSRRESGGHNTPADSASAGGRPTKRRRTFESLAGYTASNGTVGFTLDDLGGGGDINGGAEAYVNHRKAATKAVATPPVNVEEGHKWWDDDEEDEDGERNTVSMSAAGKAAGIVAAPRTARDKSTRKGGAREPREDRDGGLASGNDLSPDPPTEVDLETEASNAMNILARIWGEKDGTGASSDLGTGEPRKRVRDSVRGTKQATKRAGHTAARSRDNAEQDSDSAGETDSTTEADLPRTEEAMGNATGGHQRPETTTVDGTRNGGTRGASPNTPPGPGDNSDDGPAGNTRPTRKTRGQEHEAGDGGPLRDHHARPRELSRHAEARPLASARSAHVLASGPRATFAALGLAPEMVAHLQEPKGGRGAGGMGLSGPTVCQQAAVPVLAKGHNAVIKSETGSGKTLAYLLPLLCDLAATEPRVDRSKGTLAVILAPTRELSAQIFEVLVRVIRPFIWLVPGCISGGERRKSEKARLRRGVSILVCTPGRLLDHLKATKSFKRDLVRWLVLDEADRLLDMGFEKQVKEVVELLDQSARAVRSGPAGAARGDGGTAAPSVKILKRQTLLVSATLDKGVSRLAAALLSKHMRVDADGGVVESVDEAGEATLVSGSKKQSSQGAPAGTKASSQRRLHGADGSSSAVDSTTPGEFSTPRQLVQHYMTVTQKLRLPALCAFLRAHAKDKVVVFMSTCDAVDFHHALFSRARWPGDARNASPVDGNAGTRRSSGAARGKDRSERGAPGADGADSADSADESSRKAPAAETDTEFFGPGCRVMRLHGNVAQSERQSTYRAFSAAEAGVLICTDVAARGLDLPTVDWIVQYDPPAEAADYVHRVGRTARKGERGHSLLFLLPRETGYLEVLEARGLRPKPLSLEAVLCAADGGKRDPRRADEQLAYELQQGLQLLVTGDKALLQRARASFQSHVRAYAARAPDSRAVFQVRSLHLGHVARSFALKDPPTAVKVGKRVVRAPGSSGRNPRQSGEASSGGKARDAGAGDGGVVSGGGSRVREGKRRRDGGGGTGGGVRRLGLSKQTERASRAEFL